MQKNGDENQNSDFVIDLRGGGNRNAVEKRVNHQARRLPCKPIWSKSDGRVTVNFFAEMKMRRDGVFEKLRQKITAEQQNHRKNQRFAGKYGFSGLPDGNRLRQNLDKSHRKHKSRAEREQYI